MVKHLNASAVRENIDRILDEVADTGIAVAIEWQGKLLKIVLEKPSKLDNLCPRPYLLDDPEDLVHLDWSPEVPGSALAKQRQSRTQRPRSG